MARRKSSPRFTEIAAFAGVSVTTVDRVLNERGVVSDTTRRRVIEASRSLGVPRHLPNPLHGILHFDAAWFGAPTPHSHRLQAALRQAARLVGSRVSLYHSSWEEDQEAAFLRFLDKPPHPRQGLLVYAHDSPGMQEAVDRQVQRGVPVVTLTSDIPGSRRIAYAGIDNHAAGRCAAYLLARLQPRQGKVALLTNALAFMAHQQRIAGFVASLRTYSALEPLPVVEVHDDANRAELALRALHRQHGHDLVGLYDSGAASGGIAAFLRSLGGGALPTWIGHEADAAHVELLRAGLMGAAIDQDPEAQAVAGLQALLHACGDLPHATLGGNIPLRIVTPENLPQPGPTA